MLLAENDKYEIRLETDKEARTLSISDTGIGMSRDEVTERILENSCANSTISGNSSVCSVSN
jgi:HSP90 family molecular chaperone